ncbi:hypothetical protein HNR60_001612 [Rhodopseudomonas rhenobacensis]|uniref:Predicted 3'-5' exonuclease PolB-like domain-containing protein n=1 Tax=Rhodopseudomonas rhenobacensis TaxID=87461 RepID=A0A7W8DYE7_9BRAD|nr:hypothetical protein [Rhodopseudomonas rhenobacensis]MBB5046863.1 hypothetical protein [Rhodopseudomonas rhenobacensis]
MRELYIDLETIPTQIPALRDEIFARPEFHVSDVLPEIRADGLLTDAAKIAADVDRKTAAAVADLAAAQAKARAAADRAWRDTALDGWSGHIAVVGAALDDQPVVTLRTVDAHDGRIWAEPGVESTPHVTVDVTPERLRLLQFFDFIDTAIDLGGVVVVIGHNVRRFDILFLWQRCIVLGIAVPAWLQRAKDSPRYSDEFVVDTMELAGSTAGKLYGPSLDRLCRVLGLPTKAAIDGSGVWDAIADGRIDDVEEYCGWDVSRARSVHRILVGKGPLAIDLPAPASDAVAA